MMGFDDPNLHSKFHVQILELKPFLGCSCSKVGKVTGTFLGIELEYIYLPTINFDTAVGFYHIQLLSKFLVAIFSCLKVVGEKLFFLALVRPK